MKIEREPGIGFVMLSTLTEGDTFVTYDGDLCLLTDYRRADDLYVSARLMDGKSVMLHKRTMVHPKAYKAVPDKEEK